MSGFQPWELDSMRYHRALEPWLFTIDGQTFIRPECPQELQDSYALFRQYLYANGLAAD